MIRDSEPLKRPQIAGALTCTYGNMYLGTLISMNSSKQDKHFDTSIRDLRWAVEEWINFYCFPVLYECEFQIKNKTVPVSDKLVIRKFT